MSRTATPLTPRQMVVIENIGKVAHTLCTEDHKPEVRAYLRESMDIMREYVKFLGDPIDPNVTKGNVV